MEVARLHALSWRDSYRGLLSDDYLDNDVDQELQRHWTEARIEPDDLVLVAERPNGGILGFVAVWCRPEPFIDNLHVAPDGRSQGVGTRLMAAAARCLLERGKSAAFLWVFEDNRRAVALYERLGGTRTDRMIKPVFGNAVVQVKFVWTDLAELSDK
jgi:ribosomal protein S18 acetylase RimI-like enzyme